MVVRIGTVADAPGISLFGLTPAKGGTGVDLLDLGGASGHPGILTDQEVDIVGGGPASIDLLGWASPASTSSSPSSACPSSRSLCRFRAFANVSAPNTFLPARSSLFLAASIPSNKASAAPESPSEYNIAAEMGPSSWLSKDRRSWRADLLTAVGGETVDAVERVAGKAEATLAVSNGGSWDAEGRFILSNELVVLLVLKSAAESSVLSPSDAIVPGVSDLAKDASRNRLSKSGSAT